MAAAVKGITLIASKVMRLYYSHEYDRVMNRRYA
jgi:hypothetical protein